MSYLFEMLPSLRKLDGFEIEKLRELEREMRTVVVPEIQREIEKRRRMAEDARLRLAEATPVDRSSVTLADGSPVTPDHRELKDNGQQKGYKVLSDEERAKGFVRPVRRTYRHVKCGGVTSMSQAIAETYARDPAFYGGTFCCDCGTHFPLMIDDKPQFTWVDDGTAVGS